jgi:phthiocerol/phenolphthiocerol synthesis type-I polyketide synthase E
MTPAEVAQVMAEILDMDEISAEQNFFEIGGNSFLVLTLMTRVWERSGANLSMIDILRAPTPAGVSELVDHAVTNAGTPR